MRLTVTSNASGEPVAQGQTRWDRFLYWSNRFYQSDEFDEIEREYKVTIAKRLEEARSTLLNDEPFWLDRLHGAIHAPKNNLIDWRTHPVFEAWCRSEPENGKLALRLLWDEDTTVGERFNGFADVVATSGQKIPIAETSFFHMAMGCSSFPIFRATPVEQAMDFTGYPSMKEAGIKSGELGRRYEYFLRFLDNLMKRASANGIDFRDRLDAQSAMWMVTQWGPLKSWSESECQAFLVYQGNATLRKGSWPSR